MTLKQLIDSIGEIGIKEKLVNFSAGGTSLYEMNPIPVDYYPLLFISPTGNHQVMENVTVYELTLYCLERLLEDNSNDIDIFSFTIEELKNLIIKIREIDGVVNVNYNYTIRNFASVEGMDDRVNGSYATIRITVKNDTLCPID